MMCRLCAATLTETFVDLGLAALSPEPTADDGPQTLYPLRPLMCADCLLVQLPAHGSTAPRAPVGHARRFVDAMTGELRLGPDSLVVEVGGSALADGFAAAGVPARSVPAASGVAADLVVAVNAYAQVPDLVGFTAGLASSLKPDGLLTLEFPHLLRMIERRRYDAIVHGRHQYLSLLTAQRALSTAGLVAVEVEELSTYGGSLRVHARHAAAAGEPSSNTKSVLEAEDEAGLHTVDGHRGFADAVFRLKRDLLEFLLTARSGGRRVVAYGTPGGGTTLLDHCGVRADLLDYVAIEGVAGAGRVLPGSRVPVDAVDRIARDRPDYVLVLPSHPRAELAARLAYVRDWGGRLVFPIPTLDVV
jgi:C-methyltransferase C-terminal domain/Putative zinc binding domain